MPLDIIQLIQTLGGLVSGFGFGMFTKSGRVKAQADAYKAMAEAYEYRLDSVHQTVDALNRTIAEQGATISSLNHSLDDKTSRIRELTDKLWDAEHEVNRVNDTLTAEQERTASLEREIADLRVELVKFKAWHCRNAECPNRIPPNPALKGQKYEE